MSPRKSEPQSKAPQSPRKEELTADELEKISGGLKKSTGIGKTSRSADPDEGGE